MDKRRCIQDSEHKIRQVIVKNNEYKITIATVVYNGAATVAEAIESVMAQSYRNIEYVIMDGASKDGTQAIVQSFAKQHPNIRFISEPDGGIYDAMNKVLQLATGDFLLFLGCDDVLYSNNIVEDFVKLATDRNRVYYGDVFLKDTKETWQGVFSTEKLIMQNICHQGIFYPKQVYKNNTYNTRYKFFADWDYNLKIWAKEGPFKRVDLIITLFAENGASHSHDSAFSADRARLIQQYFGSGYAWLIKMQRMKQRWLGKTDFRKVKGYIFPKIK